MNGILLIEDTTGAVILSKTYKKCFGIPDLLKDEGSEGAVPDDESIQGMMVAGLLTAMKMKCKAAFSGSLMVDTLSGGGVQIVMKTFTDSSLLCIIVGEEPVDRATLSNIAASVGMRFIDKHSEVIEGAATGRIRNVSKSVKKMIAEFSWEAIEELNQDIMGCLNLICRTNWLATWYSPALSLAIAGAQQDGPIDFETIASTHLVSANRGSPLGAFAPHPPIPNLCKLVLAVARMHDLYFSDHPQLLEMHDTPTSRVFCVVAGDLYFCFRDVGDARFNASYLHQLITHQTVDSLYSMMRFAYAHDIKVPSTKPRFHTLPPSCNSSQTSTRVSVASTDAQTRRRLSSAKVGT